MALSRGGPLVTMNDVRVEARDNSGEFYAAKVSITGGKDVTIEDLLRRTDGMLQEGSPQGFVKTAAFLEAVRILNQCSVCAITGRPGQGKTALAHALLRHYRKLESCRPCIILSPPEVASVPYPHDWEDVREDERYVLLLDDMLGSSNFLPSLLDQWSEGTLPALWPKVASGQVKVIATFRTHIYKMAAVRLRKSQVFGGAALLDLNDLKLQLTSQERKSILQKFASKYGRHLSEDSSDGQDLDRSMELSADIGFPACCRLFVTSHIPSHKMAAFFAHPLAFVLSQFEEIRDSDPDSYLTMVFLLLKGGSVRRSQLRAREISEENRDLLEMLRESIAGVTLRSLGSLVDRLDKLTGLFLDRSCKDDVITFCHRSVMDALFVFYCKKENLQDALELCPVTLLTQYVRTEPSEESNDVTHDEDMAVMVDRPLWPVLGDRLLKEMGLPSGDLDIALSHPSLRQADFVEVVMTSCLGGADVDFKTLCLKSSLTSQCKVPMLDYHCVSVAETQPCKHGEPLLQWQISQSFTIEHVLWRHLELYRHNMALALVIERGLSYLALCMLRGWLPVAPRELNTPPSGSKDTSLETSRKDRQENGFLTETLSMLLTVATRVGEVDIAHALLERGAVVTRQTLLAACSSQTNDEYFRSLFGRLGRQHLSPDVIRDLLCLAAQNFRLSFFQIVLENVSQWEAFFEEAEHVLHVLVLQGHAGVVRSSSGPRPPSADAALCLRQMLVTLEKAVVSQVKGRQLLDPEDHLVPAFAHENPAVLEWLLDRIRSKSDAVIKQYGSRGRSSKTRDQANNDRLASNAVASAVAYIGVTMETESNNLVHVAAKLGCVETLRFLRLRWPLAFQMTFSRPNRSGQTPLFLAASRARTEVVEFLIRAGSDVNIRDRTGNTWVHAAVECLGPRSLATLRCLELPECQTVDLNCLNRDGVPPLLVAARRGSEDAVRFLLHRGALVNRGSKDSWGNTWLHYATSSGLLPSMACLFRLAEVDVNVANDNGDTPLHVAAGAPMIVFRVGEEPGTARPEDSERLQSEERMGGQHEPEVNPRGGVALKGSFPVQPLIRQGSIRRHTVDKPTPMEEDILRGMMSSGRMTSTPSKPSLQFLLSLPSLNLNAENLEGKVPVVVALENKQENLADLLVDKGADVVGESAIPGTSVLQNAIRYASQSFVLDIIDRVMKSPSGTCFLEEQGCRLFTEAILRQRVKVVERLLAEGVSVGSVLEELIRDGSLDIFRILGSLERMKLELATLAPRYEPLQRLQDRHGTDVSAAIDEFLREDADVSPLHVVALLDEAEAARVLVEAGAYPNYKGLYKLDPFARLACGNLSSYFSVKRYFTPLELATYSGSLAVSMTLLKAGADPKRSVGADGSTVLHLLACCREFCFPVLTKPQKTPFRNQMEPHQDLGYPSGNFEPHRLATTGGDKDSFRKDRTGNQSESVQSLSLLQTTSQHHPGKADEKSTITQEPTLTQEGNTIERENNAAVDGGNSPSEEPENRGESSNEAVTSSPMEVSLAAFITAVLQRGVELEARAAGGWTALHMAVYWCSIEAVRALLDADADLTATTHGGRTVFHLLATIDESVFIYFGEDVLHLLAKRAALLMEEKSQTKLIDRVDDSDDTALCLAIKSFNDRLVSLLLEAGATPEERNSRKIPNLHLALSLQAEDVVRALLSSKSGNAELHATQSDLTTLQVAVWTANTSMVTLLLDAGADVSAENHEGNTALHFAVIAPEKEVFALVLAAIRHHEASSSILDKRNKKGLTALHIAALAGKKDVVRSLKEAGADPAIPDALGLTAAQLETFKNRRAWMREILSPKEVDALKFIVCEDKMHSSTRRPENKEEIRGDDATKTSASGSSDSESSTVDSEDSSESDGMGRTSPNLSRWPLGRKKPIQMASTHAEGDQQSSDSVNEAGDARLTRLETSSSETSPSEDTDVEISDSGSEEMGGNLSEESQESDEETPRFRVSGSDEESEEASSLSSDQEERDDAESSENLTEMLWEGHEGKSRTDSTGTQLGGLDKEREDNSAMVEWKENKREGKTVSWSHRDLSTKRGLVKPTTGLRLGQRVVWSDGEWLQEASSTPTRNSVTDKKTEGRAFRSPSLEVKSQRSKEGWDRGRRERGAFGASEEMVPQAFIQKILSRSNSQARFRPATRDNVRVDLGNEEIQLSHRPDNLPPGTFRNLPRIHEKSDVNLERRTHLPEEARSAEGEASTSRSANHSAKNLTTKLEEVERAIARYRYLLQKAAERGEPLPPISDTTPEPLLHLAVSMCHGCSRHFEPFFHRGPGTELTQSSFPSDLITFLLELPGTDVNARDSRGMTSLHVAVKAGNVEGVRRLVEAGGDITLQDIDGNSPVHQAVLCDASVEVMQALLESKMELAVPGVVSGRNKEGLSPLHLAVQRNNASLAQALVIGGADVTAVDLQGNSPFHYVALHSADSDVFYALLRSPFNRENTQGQTALHLAVAGNNAEVTSLLLKEGADVTIPDRNGDTPFHAAVRQDASAEVVGVMVSSAPASVMRRALAVRNNQKLTAMQMAVMRSREHLVNVFKEQTSQGHSEMERDGRSRPGGGEFEGEGSQREGPAVHNGEQRARENGNADRPGAVDIVLDLPPCVLL